MALSRTDSGWNRELPCMKLRALGYLLALMLLVPGVSAGQRYGRWWWDGRASIRLRQTDSLVGTKRVARQEQQDLGLSLGLNGFVMDPRVARFRLRLNLNLTELEGRRDLDTDRQGYQGEITLFPLGPYRADLFFRHQLLDYGGVEAEQSLRAGRFIDSSDRWGGRLRLRAGPLRGTVLGTSRSTTTFRDADAGREAADHSFVEWTRSGASFHHHLKVEQRELDYGFLDAETSTLTANLDERYVLGPTWHLDLNGIAVLQDFRVQSGARSSEIYRLRGRVYHEIRGKDTLELNYTGASSELDSGADRRSNGLFLRYRWRAGSGWEVAPFTGYRKQSSDSSSSRSPEVGVVASWKRRREALTLGLNGRAAHRRINIEDSSGGRSESRASYGLSLTLQHRPEGGLGKEIELESARSEIRTDDTEIPPEPDFILARAFLGTTDQTRARVSLTRHWEYRSLSGLAEWTSLEAERELGFDGTSLETLRAAMHYTSNLLTLKVEGGESTVRESSGGESLVSFIGGSASWQPLPRLNLSVDYRSDQRQLLLLPDHDGERFDAWARWSYAALDIEVRAFERVRRFDEGRESAYRGVSISITRRFAAWLPIVTREGQRGVIR